ncbi:MAG: AAA family ATPase [Nannocystaceae bacterium]
MVGNKGEHGATGASFADAGAADDDLIGGRFRVVREIASGGMGRVFFARDRAEDDAPIALKILEHSGDRRSSPTSDVSGTATDGLAQAADRESTLLAEFRHPGIVRFIASGVGDGGEHYIAMEWVDGDDLGVALEAQTLTIEDTIRLGRRVAESLAAAHRIGVIHRDIKPGNIILTEGRPELAKLIDFGIAQITRRSLHRGGTPGFAAPEQFEAGASIDARADVFALGRVLIACLLHGVAGDDDADTPATDVTPSDFDELSDPGVDHEEVLDLATLCPGIPPALESLIRRMVDRDRERRPANASVVASALQEIADASFREEGELGSREARLTATIAMPAQSGRAAPSTALQDLLERYDASLEPGDGVDFVALQPRLAEDDLSVRVARCALELRALLPEAPLALHLHRSSHDLAAPRGEAAALLSEARADAAAGVVLSDAGARLLGVRFEVARRGAAPRLLGERPATGVRDLLGRPSPWIGRQRELTTLIARAAEGRQRPVAALVLGDAGIGKSRLAYELISVLEASVAPPRVLSARGDPVTAGAPFALVTQLLKSAVGVAEGDPVRTQRRRIRRALAPHVSAGNLERLTIFLAELVGAPFDAGYSEALRVARLDPALMSQQTRRAWIEGLVALSRAQPLLLWIDDLQWGDLASVRYIDALLDPVEGARVFVLAGGRPEVQRRFSTLWSQRKVSRVALAGLNAAECRAFVVQTLAGRDLPVGLLDEAEERTQGSPLFLEELVRAVDEGTFDELPATIHAIIQARLQALDYDARQVLRAASVFGQIFWLEGVAALRGRDGHDGGDVGDWLDALVTQELVARRATSQFPGMVEYAFRNSTTREAVYATLGEAGPAHVAAGRWLARSGERTPLVLAEHFRRGAEFGEAARYYADAADLAFARQEFDAVLSLVAQIVDNAPSGEARGRLLLRRAEVQAVQGRHHEAGEAALAALEELPETSPRWCSAIGEAALAAARVGDTARVVEITERIARFEPTAEGGGENLLGLVGAAVPLAAAGAGAGASGIFDRIVDVTAKVAKTDPGALGPMHSARALKAIGEGAVGTVYAEMSAAVHAFEAVGSIRNALELSSGAGFFCLELGLFERGEALLRKTIRRTQEAGLEHLCAVARHNLGRRLADRGRTREALELEYAALASFELHDNHRMRGLTLAHIAWALLLAGRLEEALAQADAAVGELDGEVASQSIALATRAQVHLHSSDSEAALADAQRAMDGLAGLDRVQEGESLIRLTWAEALAASGRKIEARAALDVARRSVDERAAKIHEGHLRESFWRLPEHAKIARLSRAWLGV